MAMTSLRKGLLVIAGLTLAGVGVAASLIFSPAPAGPAAAPPTPSEITRLSLAPNESLVEGSSTQPTPVPLVRVAQASDAKPAAVCRHCGVVQSVRAVQKKGKGTGVGAVAGGVVGGVVGNQFGKGNGRAAMTVLGAVGGGVAGNEIEKRSRSITVYQLQVRMDDGRVRSFERQSALAAGTRVVVDGQQLRVAKGRGRAPTRV